MVASRTWPLAFGLILALVPIPPANAASDFWAGVITDTTGDPKPTTDCTVECSNGHDPSVDLVTVSAGQNATHIFFRVRPGDGGRWDLPLSTPPAYNSYLFFEVDGHRWEIVARDQEGFKLVKDPSQIGGDFGTAFVLNGEVDKTGALEVVWSSMPNSYEASIDTRVFARAAGPPTQMRLSHVWIELYGHKGNPASYYDRAPDTGDRDLPVVFTPLKRQLVTKANEGAWALTSLDPVGVAASVALHGADVHVAYVKVNGTPSGAAGLYHASRNGTSWSFERLPASNMVPTHVGRPETQVSTLLAAGATDLWLGAFPAEGAMEIWHRGTTWTRESVPESFGDWHVPPSFVPSLAMAGHRPALLARSEAGLSVLIRGTQGWLVNATFEGGANGRMATDEAGEIHVAWHASATDGALPALHYATSADGWTDRELPVLVADHLRKPGTILESGAFDLAISPKGVPTIAWAGFDFSEEGAGGPQLWSAPIVEGDLGNATLVSVPLVALQPDSSLQAAFDSKGNLGILHGHAQANAYSIVKRNGTVWTAGFAPRELAGMTYDGTRLVSVHLGFSIGRGVILAEHDMPEATLFHAPRDLAYEPLQPPAPLVEEPTLEPVAQAAQPTKKSPAAGPLLLLVLAAVALGRRR